MKQFLFYAIPTVVALAACNKNNPPQQEAVRLVTLSVGSAQKATATSGTALGAAGALGTPAEFTVTGSPVKANGNASVNVENAQLPTVNATGSVVGVVKLTLNNLSTTDNVSVKLKEAAKGEAVVKVVAAVPTTGALKDGKIDKSLTTTAETLKGKELYLLLQSGANGFSEADKAVVEITAKDTKFTITVAGKGSVKKAENTTTVNKVFFGGEVVALSIAEQKTDNKDKIKTVTPAADGMSNDAQNFETETGPKAGNTVFSIVVKEAKKDEFKVNGSGGGKIGVVGLVLTNANTEEGKKVTFTAKATNSPTTFTGKVALVATEPKAETAVFKSDNSGDLDNTLTAAAATDITAKLAGVTASTGNKTEAGKDVKNKITFLLFQSGANGFTANDKITVTITATAGTGAEAATKDLTVDISLGKAAVAKM